MTKALRNAALACIAIAGCASIVAAQDRVPRFAHPGRVVDADGKAIANASVTFVSAPRLGASPNDDDVVRATTGADGRFRVDLVPTRHYRAWAVTAGEPRLASPLAAATAPATELRLAKATMPVRGTLANATPWLAEGTVTLQFVVAGSAWATPTIGIDAAGDFVVPMLPADEVDVRMYCRDRLVMLTERYSVLSLVAVDAPTRLQTVCIEVRNGNRVPIAGAAVGWLRHSTTTTGLLGTPTQIDRWPLADVGTDGVASIVLAADRDAPIESFHAKASDGVIATTPNGDFSAPGRVMNDAMQLTCYAEASVAGRVHNAPPNAGVRFLATPSRDKTRISPWLAIAADQPFAVPNDWEMKPEQSAPRARAVWLGPWQPRLAADDPFARVAVPQPVLVDEALLTSATGFDFASITPLRLQIRAADGAPAIGADVYVMPRLQTGFVDPELALRLASDASGRCLAGLAAGGGLVFALHGDEFGWTEVESPRPVALELRLQPLARMPVRVVDPTGKPLANQQLLSIPERSPTGTGFAATLATISLRVDAARPARRTDRDGRIALLFVPAEGVVRRLQVSRTVTGLLLQPSVTETELLLR